MFICENKIHNFIMSLLQRRRQELLYCNRVTNHACGSISLLFIYCNLITMVCMFVQSQKCTKNAKRTFKRKEQKKTNLQTIALVFQWPSPIPALRAPSSLILCIDRRLDFRCQYAAYVNLGDF